MQISDLTGLSAPLKRLIEVLAQGVGAVAGPYLIRARARAQADAAETMAAALSRIATEHHLPTIMRSDGVELWQRPEDGSLRLDALTVQGRVDSRLEYQERKRQANLEAITACAAEELTTTGEIAAEAPDPDWVARFFGAAQDISSNQMRELWGRILAGEIRQPGTYSLRTLDTVRNLTGADAALVERVAKFSLVSGGNAIVPVHDMRWLTGVSGLQDAHRIALAELGIMYPTALAIHFFTGESDTALVRGSQHVLLLDKGESAGEVSLPVWKFTEVGKELLNLIVPDDDLIAVRGAGSWLSSQHDINVRVAKIVALVPGDYVRYRNSISFAELPPEGPWDPAIAS